MTKAEFQKRLEEIGQQWWDAGACYGDCEPRGDFEGREKAEQLTTKLVADLELV
jgi:hypothetical protein